MPAVSLTVWLPVFRTCSPVLPPSPTLTASGSVTLSICRLNLPGSVLGSRSFLTSSLPVSRRVGDHADDVVAQGDRNGQGARVVARGARPPCRRVPLPSLHTIDLAYFARSVPRTALSPTVWSPVLSVRSPVVPPSPTFCDPAFGELPSIRRLKRPVSVLGFEVLLHLELAGLARVGDQAHDVGASGDGDGQRSGVVAGGRLGDHGAGAVVVAADDRLLVVVQVGAGAGRLADGVVAGVEGLLAGRPAVADVGRVRVGRAVDLEVELAGVRVRIEGLQ